jgi:hypothetical protein
LLRNMWRGVGEAAADEIDLYARVSGNLRRLLEAVGLQRRPRDVTPPSVEAYLAHKQQRAAS